MDKKNTMLLTVIAVATLLVAVVGATFAYFSATTEGNSTTTVTATTASVPRIELQNKIASLGLKVSAEDMKQGAAKAFYAKSGDLSTKGYEEEKVSHIIADVKATEGEATDTYNCTFSVVVTKGGAMKDLLTNGDAKIYLTGLGITEAENGVDLSSFGGDSKTFTGTKQLNASTGTDELKADLEFNNTISDQNTLAGKELTVTIVASITNCELLEA